MSNSYSLCHSTWLLPKDTWKLTSPNFSCMCSNAYETQRVLFVSLPFLLTTIQSNISLRGWGIFFSDFQIFHTHFVYEMFLCLFVNETRRYFVEGVGHIVFIPTKYSDFFICLCNTWTLPCHCLILLTVLVLVKAKKAIFTHWTIHHSKE